MLSTLRLISRFKYGVQSTSNSNQHLVNKNVNKSWIPAQLQLSQHQTIHQTNRLLSEDDDYYSILRIDKNATPDEIRAAYSRLSREYSPNRVANLMESAKYLHRINRAFAVLYDTERRKMYDFAIGTAGKNEWKPKQEYYQSAEHFADEREAAFSSTKNRSESRFQHGDLFGEKTHILNDNDAETKYNSDDERTEKNIFSFFGICFIVYCFSVIFRFFEDRKFAKMVKKNLESKTKSLE